MTRNIMTRNAILVAEYDAESVISLIRDRREHPFSFCVCIDGITHTPKKDSQRYILFSKNTSCVCCKLVGTTMVLEKYREDETPHFNLYATNDEGEKVLMTKDHIKPKSLGGRSIQENYQTMCLPCNEQKGSKY